MVKERFPSGGSRRVGRAGRGWWMPPPARPANVVTCQSGISMKDFIGAIIRYW